MLDLQILENTPMRLVMELSGDLNSMTANELIQHMDKFEEELDRPIHLKLDKLEYISSTGLRCFLLIKKAAESRGQKVYIQGMTKNVASILHLSGLNKMFDIVEG